MLLFKELLLPYLPPFLGLMLTFGSLAMAVLSGWAHFLLTTYTPNLGAPAPLRLSAAPADFITVISLWNSCRYATATRAKPVLWCRLQCIHKFLQAFTERLLYVSRGCLPSFPSPPPSPQTRLIIILFNLAPQFQSRGTTPS